MTNMTHKELIHHWPLNTQPLLCTALTFTLPLMPLAGFVLLSRPLSFSVCIYSWRLLIMLMLKKARKDRKGKKIKLKRPSV